MFGPRDVSLDPVQPIAFVSATDAKAYVGVTGSADDALIDSLCKAASASLEGYCNTIFGQRTVTEIMWPEDAITSLVLAHSPAISLTSISFDDTAQTVGNYLLMKSAGVVRNSNGDQIPAQKVTVVYVAGYGTLPDDVLEATRQLVKFLYGAKSRDAAIASESIDGVGSAAYRGLEDVVKGPTGVALPGPIAALVARHVRSFNP